jgi:hypothetical protein
MVLQYQLQLQREISFGRVAAVVIPKTTARTAIAL